ncbi:MAG: polysaccharide deacetylase family protein [Solirubrobacteraceae bacterium]
MARLSGGRRRRRRLAAQHRRRRALALLGLCALVLVVIVSTQSGGAPASRPVAVVVQGFFGQINALGGAGPRSLANVERVSRAGAIDRTLAYTPYIRIAGSQHRELALTFDDGPGPYTPAILSILQRENAPATFFEVGVLERYFHASTSQIVSDGYVVGDHTQLHAPMSRLSRADQRAQILEQARAASVYGAPFPRLFRPPYGMWNSTTLALLRRYRMLMVLWTVDTADYRRPGVAGIVDAAVNGARPGAIILLHDAGGERSETVAALPRIIARLRSSGYRLVTVPQLLVDNPAPQDQQISAILGTGS